MSPGPRVTQASRQIMTLSLISLGWSVHSSCADQGRGDGVIMTRLRPSGPASQSGQICHFSCFIHKHHTHPCPLSWYCSQPLFGAPERLVGEKGGYHGYPSQAMPRVREVALVFHPLLGIWCHSGFVSRATVSVPVLQSFELNKHVSAGESLPAAWGTALSTVQPTRLRTQGPGACG